MFMNVIDHKLLISDMIRKLASIFLAWFHSMAQEVQANFVTYSISISSFVSKKFNLYKNIEQIKFDDYESFYI